MVIMFEFFVTLCQHGFHFHPCPNDVPSNSLRNPNVGPRMKQRKKKKKKVEPHSLACSISGVGGHVGVPRWD
jgi:hypothetical protein